MKLKYFDDKDQLELLKLVYKNYFDHNFGTISKSEFELLLFTFYYEKGINNDDFSLSVDLGITQNRIRSFKEKMALRNNVFDDDES